MLTWTYNTQRGIKSKTWPNGPEELAASDYSGAADPSHGEEGSGLLSIPDLCQWHVEWLTPA